MYSDSIITNFSINSTTRDKIIRILSEKWPLNAKEIYLQVQKNSVNDITYQSVHKTLNQLIEEKIVAKSWKKYELDINWIDKLKLFSNNLFEIYSDKNKLNLTNNTQEEIKLFFTDESEFVVEMAKLFADKKVLGKGEAKIIGLLRHAWWPLKFKFQDFNILLSIIKNNKEVYLVIQEDTPFDKWIEKQYKKSKMKGVKIGEKNLNLEYDTILCGDSIIEIKFSENTKNKLDEIYSKIHNLGDLFKEYAKQKQLSNKSEIEVVITKNPSLAFLLRKQFIEKFFKK